MEAHHTGRRVVVVSADRPDRLRGTGANQTTAPGRHLRHLRAVPRPDGRDGRRRAGRCCGTGVLAARADPAQRPARRRPAAVGADPDTWWQRPTTPPRPAVDRPLPRTRRQPRHAHSADDRRNRRHPPGAPAGPRSRGTGASSRRCRCRPTARCCRSGRAPSSSPATTPDRPHACSPRPPAGRSSPSPRRGRASAGRPCAPDGCCSPPTCAATSSASSSSATRPCPAPSRASSATRASRSSPSVVATAWPPTRAGSRACSTSCRGSRPPTTRPGSTPGVTPTTDLGALIDAGLAAPAGRSVASRRGRRPVATRRRGCRGRRGRRRHDARRRLVEPRARPRRHGHTVDAARAPLRRRQPWPRRHRRHGVDGRRRRPRPPASRAQHRLPRRPDLPPRHERPADRSRSNGDPDLTFVVLSDDGGAIFSTLEQGDRRYASAFERVFATPHGTDLEALCAAHHTAYERVDDLGRLAEALAESPSGTRVLEVPVSRADRRAEAAWLRELAQQVVPRRDDRR